MLKHGLPLSLPPKRIKGGKNMKIGGISSQWFFPRDHAGKTFTGEFNGTKTIKTKNGDQQVVVFVATISGETAEWMTFPRNFKADKEIDVDASSGLDFTGIVHEKFIEVKL